VIGQMLAGGTKTSGEVIGTQLSPADFYAPTNQILYDAIYSAYFADDPIDPLSIGEVASKRLAKHWSCEENEAIVRVRDLATGQSFQGNVLDHGKVVKRHSDYRHLLTLAASIQKEVGDEQRGPEEIAGIVSHQAMRIATASLLTNDLISFGDLGRNYIKQMEQLKKATEEGLELGAYFDLRFLDRYLRGLQPTELLILAGEPGVGKSAVMLKAALKFAQRQSVNTPQIGCLILSLEMGEGPSNIRLAQTIAQIDGAKLREGKIDRAEAGKVLNEWARRKDIPLWFNFTSHMRAGQLRALVVEAIRRHNVGLVVIDHMRYFDMDERYENQIQEDEEKARFLKESIAKDLNCAVICIAHTTKGIENQVDRRPTLSNLRGSGQVAAHADFVSFVYRPFKYAEDDEKLTGAVTETDAEMIWRKNRHGLEGIEEFYFKADTMDIRDR
jgi:replicative DNA helicase